MKDSGFNDLVLQSSFDEIDRLEPYLQHIRKQAAIDPEQFPRVRLAVNEAVTNAIVHGNRQDTSKTVRVSARQKPTGTLIISVQDQGEGFDPESLPDPLQEENLLKESGRGIFLIRESTDRLRFKDNGTRLILEFDLSE